MARRTIERVWEVARVPTEVVVVDNGSPRRGSAARPRLPLPGEPGGVRRLEHRDPAVSRPPWWRSSTATAGSSRAGTRPCSMPRPTGAASRSPTPTMATAAVSPDPTRRGRRAGASSLTKALYDEIGPFDEWFSPAFCEDTDYWHRAWQAGIELSPVPAARVVHARRTSSLAGSRPAAPGSPLQVRLEARRRPRPGSPLLPPGDRRLRAPGDPRRASTMSFEHVAPYLDHDGLCQAPIFVIGSPRSGTTALAQSLGRHPASVCGQGVIPTSRSLQRSADRGDVGAPHGAGDAMLVGPREGGARRTACVHRTGCERPLLEPLAGQAMDRPDAAIHPDGRDDCRHVPRREVPPHRPRRPPCGALDGQLRAQVLARHHREGPAQRDPTLVEGLSPRLRDVGQLGGGRPRLRGRPPHSLPTVRNEDLSADPQGGFAAIAGFLDLEPHPGPATFFGKQRINSSRPRNPSGRDDDDWSEWTRSRRKEFVAVAGATMTRAGYGDRQLLGIGFVAEARAWGCAAEGLLHRAQQDGTVVVQCGDGDSSCNADCVER